MLRCDVAGLVSRFVPFHGTILRLGIVSKIPLLSLLRVVCLIHSLPAVEVLTDAKSKEMIF